MDLENLVKTKKFLEEMSDSIRNILLAHFPGMTLEEREDIDHEVKLKIWKKIADGKKIDNFRSYLWKVVYTTALDVLGERMNQLSVETLIETSEKQGIFPQELFGLDSAIEESEFKLVLEKAVDSLPDRRKAVLRLHLAGMDLTQIADSLHWTENQVRHLLYRGLNEVKKKLKGMKQKQSL